MENKKGKNFPGIIKVLGWVIVGTAFVYYLTQMMPPPGKLGPQRKVLQEAPKDGL
ncbi:MAG: hypothetical protein NTV02_03065 [Candidatus Zambryskibacteria bacterium]|nr:hypothetical protein [Candidatus Zambryskibacteria bacterium]